MTHGLRLTAYADTAAVDGATAGARRLRAHRGAGLWGALMVVLATALTASPQDQSAPQWQDVVRNLRHPKPEVRLEAVERLGSAAYVTAAEPVALLLLDLDPRVQAAAIDAELSFFLADHPDSGFKSRAQAAFETGPLVRGAAPAPTVVIDRLIAAIRDETPRVSFDAIHAVGFIAETPLSAGQVQALSAELHDHYDPVIRAAIARVLGRLRAREASDALVVALADSSPIVRLYATEALGLLREPRVADPARGVVARGKGEIVAASLLALARVGDRDDVELFRRMLNDRNAHLRRAAAEGLGRAGDVDSGDKLTQAMSTDRADEVRLAAAFALQRLGQTESHVIAAMLVLPDQRAQARDYLLELGHSAAPGVESALEVATNARHRADLVRMLGYVGSEENRPTLDGLQQDRDEHVRRAAATAIARLQR
ncbi:MAG: HEAT repeat domain-containing protein [Vicinamibacterales bacterium]